jgi:hypothetical protein
MLYPIGIQSFSEIRNGGYVYVDKTADIYKLVSTGKYYFLSRPRRFGKSLLISTMEAYFKGRKELFKGLAIEKLEKDWEEYPVLHFDFSGGSFIALNDLTEKVDGFLCAWEKIYGKEKDYESLPERFSAVIDAAYRTTGKKVVVLIDEYEKPIIDNIDNPELMDQFRRFLQGIYSILKGKDEYIRFAFLTGVTKLSKMSIFSGLNNLEDISMSLEYSDICGISEAELKSTFDESVETLAQAHQMSKEECYSRLAKMYDGYHFHPAALGVYNPFSLINTFKANEFKFYWFATGTPTFLVRYLRQTGVNLDNISRDDVAEETLTGANYNNPEPVTLMYQTGYLTITGYNPELFTYNLDYPNLEVRRGFLNSLSQIYAPSLLQGNFSVYKFLDDVKRGDVDGFMNRFTAFLSGNNYEIQGDLELYFQNTMSIMFKMIGLYVKTEYQTSNGRIDIVIETDKYAYIIELKRDQSPETALQQIEAKGYAKPFLASGKQIIKLGINFSSQTRTVDGWKMAE